MPGSDGNRPDCCLTSSGLSQMATRVPAWLEEIGAGREESDKPDTPDETSLKVNITVGDRTITATMEDNAAGRDFLPVCR